MQRIVRRIYWVVFVAMILIAPLTKGNMDASTFALACIVGWWFLGVIPSRWIAAMMLSTVRCKHCGLEIPAVNKWRIGSYQDHRERHIILAKSPIDGSRIGNLPCPQCSATILV